jgi:hypothetical protein
MKKLLVFTFLMGVGCLVFAQSKLTNVTKNVPQALQMGLHPDHRNCHTTQMEEKLQEKYPNRLSIQAFEKVMAQHMHTSANARVNEQLYRIPTIVHVIHNGESLGEGANISEAQVLSQFDVLNDDFRKRGAGANDDPVGADILVEFYPATFDEDGNLLDEPGINRVNGEESFWGSQAIEEDLKPVTIWDPEKYFNIWVLQFGGDLDGVLGYAQFPSMSGLDGLFEDEGAAETDGIVVGYQYFGTTGNVQAPFDGGRTTTHEVGHWLGLRHIWGDGGCEVDDYCADTPPAGEPNYECPDSDTCPDDDFPDMVENYMDYTNDACMNIFTQDQKDRIRMVLEVSPRRSSLTLPPCEEAEEITAGTVEVAPPAWYSYTAEEDEVVTISSVDLTEENTFLAVYTDCTSPAIVSIDNSFGSDQSAYSLYLEEGESTYFLWNNLEGDKEFEFELTGSTPEDGLACDLAIDAEEGSNNVATTDADVLWYTFTMPDELSKIVLDIDEKATVYKGACDKLDRIRRKSGKLTLFDIEKDEVIFLAIEPKGGDFSFDIEVVELDEGEACATAVEIQEGDYISPGRRYWYELTGEDFGEYIFETKRAGTLSVYDECGVPAIISQDMERNDPFPVAVDADETLKVLWEFEESDKDYEWSVAFEPFPAGAICETAILIEDDTIDSDGPPIWYKYQLTQDGTVTISSVGLTDEDTYLVVFDECSGSPLAESDDFGDGLQSQVSVPDLSEGDELLILWFDAYSSAEFSWTVDVRDNIPGEFCETAEEASTGENTTVATETGLNWFTFTPQRGNRKIVIESEAAQFGGFAIGDCQGGFDLLGSGIGKAVLADFEKGEEIYIVWENDGENDFEWSLRYEEFVEGNRCSTALEAQQGVNQITDAPAWFTYTMIQDGSLRISSVGFTEEDTYLLIYDECEGNIITGSDNAGDVLQSEVVLQDLKQGDTYYIHWLPLYTASAFDWEIEEFTPPPGSTCSSAKVIQRPEVITDAVPPIWYSYTMPRTGDLIVSSLGLTQEDTYLQLFDGCGQSATALGFSDDFGDGLQSEVKITDLDSGSAVKIQWLDFYSNAAFSFELSLDNIENVTPDISDQTFELDSKMTDGDTIGFIMANDADQDRLLFVTNTDMMDMVSIDSLSGVIRLTDKGKFMNYRQDLVVDVEVTDGIASGAAKITFLNNLLSLSDPTSIKMYPNPASAFVRIEVPGYQISEVYILDVSSKRIDTPAIRDGELSVGHLEAGIYFVQVVVDGVTKTMKLVID